MGDDIILPIAVGGAAGALVLELFPRANAYQSLARLMLAGSAVLFATFQSLVISSRNS